MLLHDKARAKVNLTLAVLGRRADGFHVLDSLVAFAGIADELSLEPGRQLSLTVNGPTAAHAGAVADNLVIKASSILARLRPGLTLGHFHLTKNLPAAAGIGGGSSDAATALRLLARANGLSLADPAVIQAARGTGSDVPVCLAAETRWMRGAGENLSPSVALPPLAAVLVNPRVATPTGEVFRALALAPGDIKPYDEALPVAIARTTDIAALIDTIAGGVNDLESSSINLRPIIGEALSLMRAQTGCRLARMSGSGATIFGLFERGSEGALARDHIAGAHPDWWVEATILGMAHAQGQERW